MKESNKNNEIVGINSTGTSSGETTVSRTSLEVVSEQIQTIDDFVRVVEMSTASSQPLFAEAEKILAELGIHHLKDIPYTDIPGADPSRTKLDIYYHEDLENAPVVLYAHGGGWVGGDKRMARFKPAALVPAGCLFISMNYRLRPKANLTDMASDVVKAVAWIKENAREYKGYPNRLFLMGHSAGAHLVSVVGTNETFLAEAGLSLRDIRGVISLDTVVYHLRRLFENPGGRVQKLAFEGNEALWDSVSPWHHVESGKSIPPFLVFYSEGRTEAHEQAIPFVERLVEAGVDAEVVEAKGKNHGDLDADMGLEGDETTRRVLSFLDRLIR